MPAIIVDQGEWDDARKYDLITDDQYNRFMRIMRRRYDRALLGDVVVYLRKTTDNSTGGRAANQYELPLGIK